VQVDTIISDRYCRFKKIDTSCNMAEADCLYPKGYFNYVPERDDVCYRSTKVYVMPIEDIISFTNEKFYIRTDSCRDFYRDTLEKLFEDAPMWSVEEKNFPKERHRQEDIFTHIERLTHLHHW